MESERPSKQIMNLYLLVEECCAILGESDSLLLLWGASRSHCSQDWHGLG